MDFLVPGNVSSNLAELMKARGLAAVLAGVVAGILRIEGVVFGGVFFLTAMLASSALVAWSARPAGDFFAEGGQVFSFGLSSGLMGFVLCWTIVYNLCHIF